MAQLIALDAGHGVKGLLAIDYNQASDTVHGKLVVPRRGGKPYTLNVTVNLGEIRKQAASLLSNRTGWSLKGARKALKKATSKAALKKVITTTNNIMKDPRFKAGIAAASIVYPPLGITYATIQQGADIVTQAMKGDAQSQATLMAINSMAAAQQGDPNAMAQVQNLLSVAKAGNPVAQGVVQNINQMSQGGQVDPQTLLQGMRAVALAYSQGADPAAAISGWFYHRVYRSPLEAGEMDRTNPRHILRALYTKGTQLERSLPRRKLFAWA